ncbi:hypothetical protein MRX96_034964 [Rhipicephalus microplus]
MKEALRKPAGTAFRLRCAVSFVFRGLCPGGARLDRDDTRRSVVLRKRHPKSIQSAWNTDQRYTPPGRNTGVFSMYCDNESSGGLSSPWQ